MSNLIQRLRDNAKGRYFWRCLHKLDKSMRIQFEDWEGHEAKEWFKEHLERFPESYRDYEMVRVHVLDQTDRLMIEAADALEGKVQSEALVTELIDHVHSEIEEIDDVLAWNRRKLVERLLAWSGSY